MQPLVEDLNGAIARVRQAGLKVFVYDDDGMTYSLVIAQTAEEAKRKVLGGRGDDEWDEDHQGLLELNGNPQ